MDRQHGYFRPGTSVITVTDAPPQAVHAHIEATLPFAHELVIVCARGSYPMLSPLPERVQLLSMKLPDRDTDLGREECFRLAACIASHQWLLRLEVGERLPAQSWRWLERLLPYVASSCTARGEAGEARPPVAASLRVAGGEARFEPRLWMTPWLSSSEAGASLAALAAHAGAPSSGVELSSVVVVPPGAGLPEIAGPPPRPQPQPPSRSTAPAVLVLGMHRSGTSLVARLVNLAGVELGDNLLGVNTPARADNPRGFWEHADVVGVNNGLMEAAIGHATEWQWTFPVAVGPNSVGADAATAMERVLERLRESPRWGFKDPRASLMLQAWLPRVGRAAAILCLRDPRGVAASLNERDKLARADGVRLWFSYNTILLEALEESRVPALVLDYERLVADTEGEMRRAAGFLCLEDKLEAAMAAIREFTDRDLQHHAFSESLRSGLERLFAGDAVEGEIDEIVRLYDDLAAMAKLPLATGRAAATPAGRPATAYLYDAIKGDSHVAAQHGGRAHSVQRSADAAGLPVSSRPGALPWVDDSMLDFGAVTVEACVPPSTPRREPGPTHFLVSKPRPTLETMIGEIGLRRLSRIFMIGPLSGGELVLYNEWFRPEKLVVAEGGQTDVQALGGYLATQPKGRFRRHSGVNQADRSALAGICEQEFAAKALDLVIDNGSHFYTPTRTAFHELFPRLRAGGLYIIESWAWAHWPGDFWQKERGGAGFANQVPASTLLIELMMASASATQFVRRVRFDAHAIYVERGDGMAPVDFDLANYCLNRGDPMPRFRRAK